VGPVNTVMNRVVLENGVKFSSILMTVSFLRTALLHGDVLFVFLACIYPVSQVHISQLI